MSTPRLKPGELDRVRTKFPDRIPIFITKVAKKNDTLPDISRHKFLVPSTFTYAELIYTIRKWLKLPPQHAIFVFIQNTIPSSSELVADLYEKYKSSDQVLRVEYTSENAFG
jgi:GABA(A) receptor-associated protein